MTLSAKVPLRSGFVFKFLLSFIDLDRVVVEARADVIYISVEIHEVLDGAFPGRAQMCEPFFQEVLAHYDLGAFLIVNLCAILLYGV